MIKSYQECDITRLKYEAKLGSALKVVVEATDPTGHGNTDIFEVNLGRTQRFTAAGVEVVTATKKGKLKHAPNRFFNWDELFSGSAIVPALNGQRGSVRRVGSF